MPTKSTKVATGDPSESRGGTQSRGGPSATKGSRRARSLRSVVAEGVRDAIMAGEYPPGSPLGEVELAERFGVSRGPVREALIQLEREYLVRSYPNRGVFVATLTEHEFDERIKLRSVLEPLALAAARDRMTPEKLAQIENLLQRLSDVASTGDQAAYVACDYEFHLAIWEISGSTLLRDMLVQVSAPVFVFESIVSERYRRAGYDVVSDASAHKSIVDYLKSVGDLDACGCLTPVLELAMQAERPVVFGTGSPIKTNKATK